MNPLFQLRRVASFAAATKDHDLELKIARAIRSAHLVMGASEVVLDSWSEFDAWFQKNRSQGLEFVMDDLYGQGSAESEAVAQLVEGYDMLERKLHDLYVSMQQKAAKQVPAVVSDEPEVPETAEEPDESPEEISADEEAPVEEAPAEEASEAEPADEGTEVSEEAEAVLTELEESTEEPEAEAEAAETEESEEAEAPAESEMVQSVQVNANLDQTKVVRRVQSMMRRASVNVTTVMYRGGSTYRLVCASPADLERAAEFFDKVRWDHTPVQHPVKHMVDVVPAAQ